MPGSKFSKKVNTPAKARQWDSTYKSVKSKGGSPGSAVRIANAAVKRSGKK